MALRGELIQQASLARYTSWRVGGAARQLYRPADLADLRVFLQGLPADEALLWVGLGSNLLIRDGGFNGTVIITAGLLQAMQVEGVTITADSGVYCSKLARQAAKSGLSGAAFLAGIPGTLGGALAMNAGAHGAEIWDYVQQATTIDRQGQLHTRSASEFAVSYRHVAIPEGEWFVSATLTFTAGDSASESRLIRELLKKRNNSQPTNQPCAGSVFRNPPGDHAGRLIESSGLKGLRIGGASVSEKHANFIVNDGTASAADIENLIALVQQKVEQMQNITLIPEVHVMGEYA